MAWWRPTPRTDDEITALITAEVEAGRIPRALAPLYEKALRDEADGKGVVMRDPHIVKRPPKKPSWSL